ncbi:RNA 2',3'-cyclic phosphodiesterase, partial [Candidatus Micrarchaeota archaeon CG11_big_fil_rev_8_21_14_0_20_47_5]
MMLFFAVELPDEVRERIFEAGRELEGKGISLVKKENLHITLKFIGEKSEHDAREIIKKASEISFESFSVRVVGVGAFPNERNARVIWVGAQA